jgi:hypothetical protein
MPSSHPLASTSDEKPVSCAVKTADILQSMIFSFSTKSPKSGTLLKNSIISF